MTPPKSIGSPGSCPECGGSGNVKSYTHGDLGCIDSCRSCLGTGQAPSSGSPEFEKELTKLYLDWLNTEDWFRRDDRFGHAKKMAQIAVNWFAVKAQAQSDLEAKYYELD